MVASTARAIGPTADDLPVDASRLLVRSRTGVLGYPDAHAIAVASCAVRIAARLGVEDTVIETIVEGALLHDVGKLRVDERILSKPGPLTPGERETIREHPIEGERIVGPIVDPRVAGVVRAHHERWDGTGYPLGLAGVEIPLAARVVAVADAYLAMCEDRPYRGRLTRDEAVQELRECSGTQFDPACVDALLAIVVHAD